MISISKRGFKKKFWEMVEGAEYIVIIGHAGPDDDSVASMMTVYWLIKERFPKKNIKMICEGEATDEWGYFENFKKIEFGGDVVRTLGSDPKMGVGPLIIMLDGSSFDRFSKKPRELKELAGKTICIDHHKNRPDKFDLLYISSAFSATTEGVYRLLVEKNKKIPKRLAEIFLLGILGDTGNFAYLNKSTAGVLEIVQKLIEEGGVSIQELQKKYQQYPKKVLKTIGEMIANTGYFESVGKWPAFQVSFLTREFMVKNKLSSGEVSSASHFYMTHCLRSIKGYGWGFVITPREDKTCGLSFRSLPGVVNARKMAEKFDGGGHDLAGGGEVKVKDTKEALERILNYLAARNT